MKSLELISSGEISTSDSEIESYTFQQVQEELRIGESTLRNRLKVLSIYPERDGQKPIISRSQFLEISALDRHMKEGGTTSTYHQLVQSAKPLQPIENTDSTSITDVTKDIWSETLRNVRDEISMNSLVKRSLRLETYYKLNQPISDSDCIEIMEFKPPRTGFRESCYEFTFYGFSHNPGTKNKTLEDGSVIQVPCLVKQKLWKLTKIDLEKEATEKAEAKKRKKLLQNQELEALANQNYQAMKEVIRDD